MKQHKKLSTSRLVEKDFAQPKQVYLEGRRSTMLSYTHTEKHV